MMNDVMQLIASLEWIVLGVLVFVRIRQWHKKFDDLYNEVRDALADE